MHPSATDDDMNAVAYGSPGCESKRALGQGIIDNPERWIGHHHCGASKISWTKKTTGAASEQGGPT